MNIKACKPKLSTFDGETVLYMAFALTEYKAGQTITLHMGPVGTPEYNQLMRCLLTEVASEIKHPTNDWGYDITEQWWKFRQLTESEFHKMRQTGQVPEEQAQLF